VHKLVILVDVLQLLATDTATRDDYQELLRDMLHALDPKEKLFFTGVRKVSEVLLAASNAAVGFRGLPLLCQRPASVHPDDRNRLKHLLRTLVERYARSGRHQVRFFNVAAVRATESVPGGEGNDCSWAAPCSMRKGS